MKALRTVLVALAILVVAVTLVGLLAPNEYTVSRTAQIEAPQSLIYDYARHFEHYQRWNPWSSKDPNMTSEIKGTDGTVGAVYSWAGNEEVGTGNQEIMQLVANERILSKVNFITPFESSADAAIDIKASGSGSEVSWGFKTRFPFPFNIMGLFMDLDAQVGNDYEKGLQNLKAMTEKIAGNYYNGMEVKEIHFPGRTFVSMNPRDVTAEEMEAFYMENLPAIATFVGEQGGEMDGMPCGLYYRFDDEGGSINMSLGIGVKAPLSNTGSYQNLEIPAGKAIQVDYYGDYNNLPEGHAALDGYLAKHGVDRHTPIIEEYVTDPTTVESPSEVLTRITYLLR
ncbi:MAG: GyrI-like domain-containing protein [Bacteroidota bacterium]